MKCPYCNYIDSKVIDSRNVNDAIRRRRECLQCNARFTTYERLHTNALMVIKKDGRHEEFSREKLANGIRKACAKRPVQLETIEQMVDEIEIQLRKSGLFEVSAATIGETVIERLRHLDPIAYIRFASVYRNFADIDDVLAEADAYVKQSPVHDPRSQLSLFREEELDIMKIKSKKASRGIAT